jgi:hypothetical protein
MSNKSSALGQIAFHLSRSFGGLVGSRGFSLEFFLTYLGVSLTTTNRSLGAALFSLLARNAYLVAHIFQILTKTLSRRGSR